MITAVKIFIGLNTSRSESRTVDLPHAEYREG